MQKMRNNVNSTSVVTRKKENGGDMTAKKSSPVVTRNINAKNAKRTSNLHAVRAPHVVNVKKKDKAPFPWSMVFVALILTGMFLFMMMNYAEVDKYRSEINDINNKIAVMEKTQDELEVQYSNKYNIGEIEKYAREELGMTNIEGEYHIITPEHEDKTEMQEYDDGEEGGFGFLLTGLGEVIRDFLNAGD